MDEIKKAVHWLKSIRNDDNGWGDLQGLHSTVFNTAEAVIGIIASGDDDTEFHLDSLNYLSKAIIDRKCYKTAQLCWATIALLSSCLSINYKDTILIALNELIKTANPDGGWGYNAEDKPIKVFPTTLALRTLILAKNKTNLIKEKSLLIEIDEIIERGIIWLISAQNNEGGWGTIKGDISNVGITAHALITLLDCHDQKNVQNIQRGISWLLSKQKENGEFPVSEENSEVAENKFKFVHISTPWAVIALLKNGLVVDKVVNTKIRNAMGFLIGLQDESGGWKKTSSDSFPFIWATYNAIIALVMCEKFFPLYPHDEKNNQGLIILSNKLNFISSKNFIYFSFFLSLSLYFTIIYLFYILNFVYLNTLILTIIIILGLLFTALVIKFFNRTKIEALGIFLATVSVIITVWQIIFNSTG